MADTATTVALVLSVAAFSVVVRLLPFRRCPTPGVDNWYWLLVAEDVKRRRRLPACLPYYMLEDPEQWYPPLYSGLLALVPIRLLERHGGKMAQLVDVAHGLVVVGAVLAAGGHAVVAAAAGASYALAYFPLAYNVQLQPRGLANLLLTLTVGGLWWYHATGSVAVWCGVLAVSVALLLLHKMTVQMWVVYLVGFGLWAWDWRIPALLPASMAAAVVVTGGFYVKVLRAHWDIVTFWHQNLRQLGSHQYYESPPYRKEGFATTAYHQPGRRGLVGKLVSLATYNVFLVMVPVLAYAAATAGAGPARLDAFLWVWLGLSCGWALVTTFVPGFQALGAGVYYMYQSFVPLFALAGRYLWEAPLPVRAIGLGLWLLAFVVSIRAYATYIRSLGRADATALNDDLRHVLDHLGGLPDGGVYCIPFQLPEVVAYWTRKKVFWGGHGYGFHRYLKPYFPVMREPVPETLRRWDLRYVLLWRGYLDALKDIGLAEGRDVRLLAQKGEYALYEVVSPDTSAPAAEGTAEA